MYASAVFTDFSTAKIDKLSIRGIRSFDNSQPEVIQFSTPLTLIVGYNGSGKTTIIESLKYATTGEMPPNSKANGAFIHDPKLAGEKEVLAQVKLSFRDPSGARLVVTRSVSVTVQRTKKLSQKTLDGSLLRVANGERIAIAHRVVELNRYVPQYLGVSRAVLDNVIFCHQDESLWPMSEPAMLKKKFDEIFEALKYTKAIDSIKGLRKHYMAELKDLRNKEQTCKQNKDRADRWQVSNQSRILSDDIERLRTECQELNKLTEDARKKNQEAWDRSVQFKHVVESLRGKKKEREFLQEQMDRRKDELEVRPESDKWLQTELDQYEEKVIAREDQQQQKSNIYEQLRRTIETGGQQLQRKNTEAGKYEQQQATHEQEIGNRRELIKQSARRHNIRGYEADLDDMQINEFMDKISKLYKEQSDNVDRVRRETEKEMQKVQETLSNLGERRSGLLEGKSSAKQQSLANDKRIESFQLELNGIEIDEGAKALTESNVKEIEGTLKQAKDEYKQLSWDTKISDTRSQLRTTEEEVERTNHELVQSTKQSKDLARLDHLKKELSDRKRTLDTLTGAHKERLHAVIGANWQLARLERDFQAALEQRSTGLRESESRQASSSRDLEQTEFKLSSGRDALRRAEKELQDCAKTVADAIEEESPESYPAVLEQLQKDRDTLEADVKNFSVITQYWKKSIRTAKDKGRCELCERTFRAESEKSDFVRKVEDMIAERVQNGLRESQADLEKVEDDLKKARSVGSNFSTWLRLSGTEVPKVQADIQRLEQSKAIQVRKGEDHDKEVADRQDSKTAVESLSKPVSTLVNVQTDIAHFAKQIEELSTTQKDAGFSPTIEEVQQRLESLNAQARAKRNQVERLMAEKQHGQGHIGKTELSLSDARNELSVASHQLEKKVDLGKRIEDLRKSNGEHRDTVRRLDDQIDEITPQVSAQETKLSDIKQRGFRKEQDLQQAASKLADSVHKLRSADQNIQAHLDNGGASRLERCQREIRNLQNEIQRTETEQKQVVVEVNKIKEELRNVHQTRRVIADNLSYRRGTRELEDVKTEIASLSAQNAEEDLEIHMKQERHWKNQYDKHSTDRTSKLATMKAKDNQLQELLKDWQTDYKNAAQEYKEAHIKVEARTSLCRMLSEIREADKNLQTTKAAVEDLGRYGSALDKAVMQYHSLKMEEINRIAEELWKRTYQGTDVDTILIRSDNEEARGNRSYNYRVCMVKQDAEMDMRGRCSAGQRVLASIIIRLALAECFGVKCGLIALDEPTTNLDRDNIRSLAESLHDIIRARQQQSNFQLIVITHDEEFLRYMKCADFCDTYFRISRTDRQKSRIERQTIADVM
ncbi:MAG: hypothetical protein Q9194_001935 [Teloschistes cf. exilis]